MPRVLDTESRTDDLASAVNRLIARGGMAAVTSRAIAAESGVSLSSLSHHFRSRARLLSVVAFRAGREHLWDALDRRGEEGVLAWLPATEDDLARTRVWLAWCELGRTEKWVGHCVAEVEHDEELLLSRTFPVPLGPDESQTAAALVRGLRAAVCAGSDPMPLPRARELLAQWSASHLSQG